PDKIHIKSIPIKPHDDFIRQWLQTCLKRWHGKQSISACVWEEADLNIWCDIGTSRSENGELWGIGAYCRENGTYVSQAWDTKIYQNAVSTEGVTSIPF